MIGRNGFAPPGFKREGDGRTPSGIYLLGTAFGYNASAPTRMPYRQAGDNDLWVDDVNSPDYNRWVRKGETHAASFERMRRADGLYKYGVVIEYNSSPVVKERGSAIFLHIWRGEKEPTAGCVALSEKDMLLILDWLDPKAKPLVVMGTESDLKREPLPDGFVDITEVIPSVRLDIRYYGPHNFLAERVDGYRAPKCIITREAATALVGVQRELEAKGMSVKIYDCFRPQRAVDHFVRWAKSIEDTRTKKEFYPTVDKRNLFRDGYIDARSGHSRGSTIDLTIVPVPTPEQEAYTPGQKLVECYRPASERFRDNGIDMGSGFDCFGEVSNTENPSVGLEQRKNRRMLKSLMEKYGFKNYELEWWHYTLKNEPFKNTYFDFEIR